MASLNGRKVKLFRCHVAPLIGPKVLNAHVCKDLGWEGEYTDCGSIHLKTKEGREHIIHASNIIMSELYPEEPKVVESEFGNVRKGPGKHKEGSGAV